MAKYLVQRDNGDEQWASLMTVGELVDYVDMSDCHDESFEVYDVSTFGQIRKLKYKGWQPGCLIQFVDADGNVVIEGYGTDH